MKYAAQAQKLLTPAADGGPWTGRSALPILSTADQEKKKDWP